MQNQFTTPFYLSEEERRELMQQYLEELAKNITASPYGKRILDAYTYAFLSYAAKENQSAVNRWYSKDRTAFDHNLFTMMQPFALETFQAINAASETKAAPKASRKPAVKAAAKNSGLLAILPKNLSSEPERRNGIAYICRDKKLRFAGITPAAERELSRWENLTALRSYQNEGLLVGIRSDGMQYHYNGKFCSRLPACPPDEINILFRTKEGLQDACQRRMQAAEKTAKIAAYQIGYYMYLILLEDGTVLSGDERSTGTYAEATDQWEHMIQIACNQKFGIALDTEGLIHIIMPNLARKNYHYQKEKLNDLIHICTTASAVVGLRWEGQLVTSSDDKKVTDTIKDWSGVIGFTADGSSVFATTGNGTLLHTDFPEIHGTIAPLSLTPIPKKENQT